jgi:hypothetical protein
MFAAPICERAVTLFCFGRIRIGVTNLPKDISMSIEAVHSRAVSSALQSIGGKTIGDIFSQLDKTYLRLRPKQIELSLARMAARGEARCRDGRWYFAHPADWPDTED